MPSPRPAALTAGDLGSVAECGATCESCFSQDFCIRCKRRFYLYKGKCLPTCPLGTAAQPSTRECQGEWGASSPRLLPCRARCGGVRRAERTLRECRLVIGGPTGDVRHTEGASSTVTVICHYYRQRLRCPCQGEAAEVTRRVLPRNKTDPGSHPFHFSPSPLPEPG